MRLVFCLFLVLRIGNLEAYVTRCEPVVSLDNNPIVKVPNFGTFRGSATVSLKKQRIIYQYLGIPYVVPPMGPLRFKAPVPLTSLNLDYEYDATNFKQKCPQLVNDDDIAYLEKNWEKAEDCLYLNVFTVTDAGENHQPLLPVMIYIHGGGYYQGFTADHCPNYLLDHDMILVTMEYRLGPLGFLNLEDEEAPGNMGLLDTLEAIEWVNKYIKYFGGDNQKVTISGQSSGGNSVSLMLVSPLVRPGLFQQAIIQSGNFLGNWAVDRHSKEHAIQFAGYVNCSRSDISEMIQCLRNVSAFELIRANLNYMTDRGNTTKNFVTEIGISHAVVQTSGTKKFLDRDPVQTLKSGNYLKIPILTGVTKDEGSMLLEALVFFILQPEFRRLHLTRQNQSVYLRNEFFYDFVKFNGVTEDIDLIELVKDYYLPEEMCTDFEHTIPGLVDLSGALVMKTTVMKFARYMFQHAPTYLYSFNYKGRKTKLGYGKKPEHVFFNGVAHSDDLLYLFPHQKDPSLNKEEEKVVEYLTSLWASFVINGGKFVTSPDIPKWPAMSTVVGPYLQITNKLRIKENFLKEYRNYVMPYV